MERAGKTTIFPGEKNACATAKCKHCRTCRILWPFMLAVLQQVFYRTIQEHREVKII